MLLIDRQGSALLAGYQDNGRRSGKSPRRAIALAHAGEDFEPQILFVAQAVGAALDDSGFVVEPLDEETLFSSRQ
jgi:hypothetical protein